MKNRSVFVLVAACCFAGLVAGCESSSKSKTAEATPAAPKQASMGIVNARCPMMNDHPATAKATREFNGKNVGFCCPGCLPKWDKMTDADKQAALNKAM